MTGVTCIMAGTASVSGTDSQTVTVGVFNGGSFFVYGYSGAYGVGTIADGFFNPKGGAAIEEFYYLDSAGADELVFSLGGTYTNDGWTTVTINGNPFNRADAAFGTSGGLTSWVWTTGTNPFGTIGGISRLAEFT